MRIFQTFVLPEALVARYHLSFAAANFSRNLISGGGFDRVFSILPVTVGGQLDPVTEEGYEVVYSGWRKRGGLLFKLSVFAEQWQVFRKIRPGDSVWLYNLNILNALLFVLLKCFRPSVRLNVIVLDFSPTANMSFKDRLFLRLINSADSLISLSTSPLFRVERSALLPGVVPLTVTDYPRIATPRKEFLLSGVISGNIALTGKVLEAFSKLPDCTLHITGKVLEDEERIRDYAGRYPNILYHGSVPYDEYLRLLHRVTFQLSTRNPRSPENQCNFPSKIIEALLHNRVIVTTIDYPQLKGVGYLKVDADALEESLKNLLRMRPEKWLDCANQSDKVKALFSTAVWNDTMARLEKA